MGRFQPPSDFRPSAEYRLLPFRFRRFYASRVLLVNEIGEHAVLHSEQFQAFVRHEMDADDPAYPLLESRHFLSPGDAALPLDRMALQYRSRKRFLFEGPKLHIFVVTLRCHHSCRYCQVSRRPDTAAHRFDMSLEIAEQAIQHVLEAPSSHPTVEFQGGEPLLAFDTIRHIVERLAAATQRGKTFRYVITSTLHDLDDECLEFMRRHGIVLSTSLDGPESLHNRNRPTPGQDSHAQTLAGLARARAVLGDGAVSALTTVTRRSLADPKPIIEEYRRQGFHSIFLRPLSPYGFASKQGDTLGYDTFEFLAFYRAALDYLIEINLAGYAMDEVYASLLLRSIWTPFSSGYVDLRSPAGAGFGTLLYNYDGGVYPSDEARMLAEMRDDSLRLGHVSDSYSDLMQSPVMQLIATGGVAESIPHCSDCAYLPYCGSDPVDSHARQGDVIGHRPSSAFCSRHMGMLDLLFEKLLCGDPDEMRVLRSWAAGRPSLADLELGG